MTKNLRIPLLLITLVLVVGGIYYFESQKPDQGEISKEAKLTPEEITEEIEDKSKKYDYAMEIVRPDGFINTDEINIMDLIGEKVIIVDFMTYTCINCQRTWPFLNAWYDKYNDQGLEIIGIHTPEFEFEKKYENVLAAVQKHGIKFPVVLDNDYATWRVYKNRYWPHKYIIDIDGFIVYDHIGEGAYEETEKVIQELLKERMEKLGEDMVIDEEIVSPEDVQVVERGVRYSPEIYFGSSRNESLGNGTPFKSGVQTLEQPDTIRTNKLYLVGDWDIQDEFAENKSSGAKVLFKYQAKNVFSVANADTAVKATVLRDGEPVEGYETQTIQENFLYELMENPDGYGEYLLEITLDEPGVRFFTFTFG